MKSFLATAWRCSPVVARLTPLHFALSYDEEVGCIGVGRLIATSRKPGSSPGAVCRRADADDAVIAHKGKRGYRCIVRGSVPLGVRAAGCERGGSCGGNHRILKAMARRLRDGAPTIAVRRRAHDRTHRRDSRRHRAQHSAHECTFDFEFRHLPGDDPEALFTELRAT